MITYNGETLSVTSMFTKRQLLAWDTPREDAYRVMQKGRNMSSLAWMGVHNMYNSKRKEKLFSRKYNPMF